MKVHAVKYSSKEESFNEPVLVNRVIWGRSARWAGRIRKQLRVRDCVIEDSFIADVPVDKSGLIQWLNANFKVYDV